MSKRFTGILLVAMLLTLFGSIVRAQDGVLFVIGWEQEPDRAYLSSQSAFSTYVAEFNQRDLIDYD